MATDTDTASTARAPKPKAPSKFKVMSATAPEGTPAIFSSESEGAVRNYIRNNHPRGREVYIQTPDGSKEHYSADMGHQGDDPWVEYSDDELED